MPVIKFFRNLSCKHHQESIHPEQRIHQNIRINILHGIFNIAAINMVNPFISIFAMRLGASQMHVALLSSAPAVVSLLAMIPGAKYIDKSSNKKEATLLFMFVNRLFYLSLILIPFFPSSLRPSVLVILIALMNFPGAIANVGWQSFISELIPPDHRATAFASRNRIMSLVGTVITLITGLLLDHLKFPFSYQLMFMAAFLTSLVELQVFNLLEETNHLPTETDSRKPSNPPSSFLTNIKEICSETHFLRYTLASMFFYFAWQIPWPLFSWYRVKILGANNLWISIFSLMSTLGSLMGFRFWVNFIEKHGNIKTLFFSSLNIFIVPAVHAFFGNLYAIAIAELLAGAMFAGINLALFNTLLEVIPNKRKTSYIAYYNSAVTCATFISPIAGVSLLKIMDFKWAFIICALLRILGSFCFLILSLLEEKDKNAHSKLGHMKE